MLNLGVYVHVIELEWGWERKKNDCILVLFDENE